MLSESIVKAINGLFFPELTIHTAAVCPVSHGRLEAYYSIRSWLEQFSETLHKRR